jgi:hypothetical protein
MWGWSAVGHGHYCIRSSKQIFSHSCPKINWTQGEFRFKSEDTLLFEYDPIKCRFKIESDSNQYFEMDVEKGKRYSFCAYLSGVNDRV